MGPRVVAGPGCLEELAGACAAIDAQRTLVVTSDSNRSPAVLARRILGNRWAGNFADVVVNVPSSQANAAVANAQEIRADSVVTIGGGSATGLGKVIALALRLPLISIPTTYAGFEMTALYGVATDRGFETGISDRARPRAVLYDPELSLTLPAAVTAACGLDAIGGCLDALWQPVVPAGGAAAATEGLNLLWKVVPELVCNPSDIHLRELALAGARLVGTALDATGPGPYRRLSWALAAAGDISPSRLSGWLLPRVAAEHWHPYDPTALHTAAGRTGPPQQLLGELAAQLGVPKISGWFTPETDDRHEEQALMQE